MELAPGVVVPADVVLQPEPGERGGQNHHHHHRHGVVVAGACTPLLSLARESLGARGLLPHIGGAPRARATFVQTVRPLAGDSGLKRAPEYES